MKTSTSKETGIGWGEIPETRLHYSLMIRERLLGWRLQLKKQISFVEGCC